VDRTRGPDHLLEVVEHEQEVAPAEEGPEADLRRLTAVGDEPKRVGDGRHDEFGVTDGGQRNEPHAVGKDRRLGEIGCDLEGQAGLADAAEAGQGDEAHLGTSEQVADGRQVPLPSHERRERERQGAGAWEG
jgi:hypothetical protein